MNRFHVLGLLLSVPIAMGCIWSGQLQVNPQARLLLLPQSTATAQQ